MRVIVSENKILVKTIREKLKANGNYCPCRIRQSEDSLCMCKEFREQISRGERGSCHCGLYEVVDDDYKTIEERV